MPADLSQPLKLPCGATLSNRLAKAAMTEGLADVFNRATERHVRLYRRWSEGGAGLLLTGNVQVDRTHLERPGNVVIDNNGGFDELRAYAKAGTSNGNHLWMQINQPGRQTPIDVNPHPFAPSAVPLHLPGGHFGEPVPMTEAQILDVIRRFAHVATVARETGFTGVQIHAAHGYLMSQFLSPLSNTRTDAWGGSLENRARVLLEIIRATRKAVGADFPVSVKLNSADFQKGGFTEEESMQVVRWLNDASVDLLEISGGNYEQMNMIGRAEDQDAPAASKKAESTRRREAYFLEYAAKLRPLVTVPLMITGGFRSRTLMAAALAAGELDLVGIARPLCADPELCKGLLDGSVEDAPAPERVLTLDRAALGMEVDDATFRIIEANAMVSWYYIQLLRLGDGLDPDQNLDALQAMLAYDANERATLAALQPLP